MLFGLPHWDTLEKNMTRTEFEQRVKDENLKMEDYSIELDEYREEHPEDKNDKGFDNWMDLPKTKSSIQSALDILVQSGAGKPIE